MMKDVRTWVAAAAALVAAWLLAPAVFPPRAPAVEEDSTPRIRFVCRKTGEVFTLPLTAGVLAHPTTGEPTLVPAVYDSRRRKWMPGPPLEVMRRRGLVKPAT